MKTNVVLVRARTVVGDTVIVRRCPTVGGGPAARKRGRASFARTHDPPFRDCERSLQHEALRRGSRRPATAPSTRLPP